MLRRASEAALSIAEVLTHRGIHCISRKVAPQPNLWWLPLSRMESSSAPEAKIDA
jgi:hypothetical protein